MVRFWSKPVWGRLALAVATGSLVTLGDRTPPALAQSTASPLAQNQTTVSPGVLAEIREAPFSQMFSVANGQAFGVKDKDYLPSTPEVGVFSLWADVPSQERLEMVMKYCLQDLRIARNDATLVQVDLLDNGNRLVTLDQVLETGPAKISEVVPPQTSTYAANPAVYANPFYGYFYSTPYYYGGAYAASATIPGVDCSAGMTRFDIMPAKAALAQLPDRTLTMRLLFSDGITADWQLGGRSVGAIQSLPTISQ
ncbi:MAG TPA: hypothetical protein IGR64_14185 [Leptolyngbyaceae cyanobacterium M65_K2018_010]|nr:hypothetical protein [Leptolyngbyaceae cyanobacterium M65_K2018_010]